MLTLFLKTPCDEHATKKSYFGLRRLGRRVWWRKKKSSQNTDANAYLEELKGLWRVRCSQFPGFEIHLKTGPATLVPRHSLHPCNHSNCKMLRKYKGFLTTLGISYTWLHYWKVFRVTCSNNVSSNGTMH